MTLLFSSYYNIIFIEVKAYIRISGNILTRTRQAGIKYATKDIPIKSFGDRLRHEEIHKEV